MTCIAPDCIAACKVRSMHDCAERGAVALGLVCACLALCGKPATLGEPWPAPHSASSTLHNHAAEKFRVSLALQAGVF